MITKLLRNLLPFTFAFATLSFAAEIPHPDAEQIARWIKQLEDADFDARTAAKKGLLESGSAARSALEAATKSESGEVRSVATSLLEQFQWDKIPADVNYLDSFPSDTLTLFHTPSIEKISEIWEKSAGGALIADDRFKGLRDAYEKYRARQDQKDLFSKWSARFKGQFTAAAWDFNLLGMSATWAVMAEMPAGDSQQFFREFLDDTGLWQNSTEKYVSGLFIRSTNFGKGAAALAGKHVIFASDEGTVRKMALSLLKTGTNPLPASPEFAVLKPVLRPEQNAVFLFNVSIFLKRTIDLFSMIAVASHPETKDQMDKVRDLVKENVWIGATLSGKGARLEESYFYVSNAEVENHFELPAVKEDLKKLLGHAANDSLLVTGFIPFQIGKDVPPPADAEKKTDEEKRSNEETLKTLREKMSDYKNLSKLLENGIPAILSGRKSELSMTLPDGEDLPVLDLYDDPSRAQELADGLAEIAEAGARDYVENLKNKGKLPKEITPEALEKKNFAVEKMEKNGQTFYLESADSKLINIPGRKDSQRLCWTACKSHLIFGTSIETLEKRSQALAAGLPGFDASAILESDLDGHPLPLMAIIDTHNFLNRWSKRVLPGLIEHSADEPDLQNALREAAKIDDPFKTLPATSITFSKPAAGAFECKIRSPFPFFPMVAAVAGVTAFSVAPVAPEKPAVEAEAKPEEKH